MTSNIPEGINLFDQPDWPLEPCAGDLHIDSQKRLWTCCQIEYGARGGRWAYAKVLGQPWKGVVVDTRQHLQSSAFAGMLALPWDGLTKLGWVLAKEHCPAMREQLVPEPPEGTRFERLDEPPTQEE
jgi:hypothetical protein